MLAAGYDRTRGSIVTAWEPLVVMFRKLLITLAGARFVCSAALYRLSHRSHPQEEEGFAHHPRGLSTSLYHTKGSLPRDPHIQIMLALLILIASLMLQALVQPYESTLLNVLDVGSLFVLILTQVLSIVYLYLDTLEGDLPLGMTRSVLESCMTAALFTANISVIITLFVAFVWQTCNEKLSVAACIAKHVARRRRSPAARLDVHALVTTAEDCSAGPHGVDAIRNSTVSRANPLAPRSDVEMVVRGQRTAPDGAVGIVTGGLVTDEALVACEQNVVQLEADNTLLKADNAQLKADNALLKADNAKLKSCRQGAVREQIAAQPHTDGAGVDLDDFSSLRPVLSAAAEDPMSSTASVESAVWYYSGADDDSVAHGPFSLRQLKEWFDASEIEEDLHVRCGVAAEWETIMMALYNAGLLAPNEAWFYDAGDDTTEQHGPYTLRRLAEWLAEGHFDGSELICAGADGEQVALADALASEAEALCGTGH